MTISRTPLRSESPFLHVHTRALQEVFSNPYTVLFYVASVLVIGAHLLWGWQKTVRKPQGLGAYLSKESQPIHEAIGNALTVGLTAAYVSLPLYTHFYAQ